MEQNGTIIMTVRRIASSLGAGAGAFALALAPTTAHAAFNHIEVGGVAVTATGTSFTGTGKSPITATLPGFGTITCSSATIAGTILPATAKVTSLAVTCPSTLPGMTTVVGINSNATKCVNGVVLTPDAAQTLTKMTSATNPPGYSGAYDTAVSGVADFGNATSGRCIAVAFKVLGSTLCSFKIGGSVPFTFNETPKGTAPAISQQLNLGGTLTIDEVSGTCPGYTNGLTVDLSVPLNITTPIASGATNPGLIDFVP
jgi:hypothetical protein